ncbi:MAG: DUF4147 domain-containing protein [Pseudomonadota bacterium]
MAADPNAPGARRADLRKKARHLFDRAVAAADPGPAVTHWLVSQSYPRQGSGRTVVLALGKAAPAMAHAALASVKADHAIVVTNPENETAVPGAKVLVGDHPVPSDRSAASGDALLRAVTGLASEDRVLVLVSGGGSALATAPVVGITDAEKATVSTLLLASGLDINRMNLVRQNLSRLKGGGLARAAAPAAVTALVLSDVIGDDLSVVASGPTEPPVGPANAAAATLRSAGLWDRVPDAVRAHLIGATAPARATAETHLVGSNRVSLQAMVDAAPGSILADAALTGDVGDAADLILAAGRAAQRPATLIFGGETTVQLTGTGRGGRNQELALRVALGADFPGDWVFLSGGTDGRDGPTDAAGAIVDGDTALRIRAAGADPAALLANNDSHAALAAAEDLLICGGTGTNVADVQALILA